MTKILALAAAAAALALPAAAEPLPPDLVGAWDVSAEACAATGTSTGRIDVAPDRIETFGGDALVREVVRIGPATFVAADFRQLEGAAEIAPRTRTHFRMDQRAGPDRMRFVWKDVQSVDLVKCDASAPTPMAPDPAAIAAHGPLPIRLGLWVAAGEPCDDPANAGWRVHDGTGLRGAASTRCEIDAARAQADGSLLVSQLCTATYDGSQSTVRDRITVASPRRFTLLEDGETEAQDFEWCGPRLVP